MDPAWIPSIPLNMPLMVLVGIAFVAGIFILVYYVLRRPRGVDLIVVEVDEREKRLRFIECTKIADNVYIPARRLSEPRFIVVPRNTEFYRVRYGGRWYPAIIGYSRNILTIPLDPKIISSVSMLLDSEEYARLDAENVTRVLSELYRMEDEKRGSIVVSYPVKLVVSFSVKRMVRDILDKLLDEASETIRHFFSVARDVDAFQRYLESLGRYAVVKYSWLIWLGILAIMVAIAFAIMGGVRIHPGR